MQDARNLAKKKLPSMIFDYVDGLALEGDGDNSNSEYFRSLKLSQNILAGGGPKKNIQKNFRSIVQSTFWYRAHGYV